MSGGARRPGQRGFALLLVVWLLALLTVVAGEFVASGRVKAAAESNKRDDLRALALALAGYRAALGALADVERLSLDADGRLQLHRPGTADPVPAQQKDVRLEDGSYSWSVADESGLVNVNTAPRPALVGLLEQCGLGPGVERDTVADSLLDWRDTNREHHINGAEEDYYRGLDPPYSCKDGPLDVVEELLLVRGVTRELFFGGERDGEKRPGLRELVTVQATQFNPATAPDAVLEALGKQRPAQPSAPSAHYRITSSGTPDGGAPPRHVQAVVARAAAGGSEPFVLLYWNELFRPE